MEVKGISYWADSIANIVKKTELNLIKLQNRPNSAFINLDVPPRPFSAFAHPKHYNINRPPAQPQPPQSFEPENQREEIRIESHAPSQAMLHSIEDYINQKHKVFKQDLDSLLERIVGIEVNLRQHDLERTEIKNSVQTTENRYFTELMRMQEQFIRFLSKDDLRTAEESIKSANVRELDILDRKIRDMGGEIVALKRRVEQQSHAEANRKSELEFSQLIDDKIQNIRSSTVGQDKLSELKNEILTDAIETCNSLIDALREEWQVSEQRNKKSASGKFDAMQQFLNEEVIAELERHRAEIDSLVSRVGLNEEEISKQLNLFKDSFSNGQQRMSIETQNEIKALQDSVDQLQSFGKYEKQIKALQTQIVQLTEQNSQQLIENQQAQLDFEVARRQELEYRLDEMEHKLLQLESHSNEISEEGNIDLHFEQQRPNPFPKAQASPEKSHKQEVQKPQEPQVRPSKNPERQEPVASPKEELKEKPKLEVRSKKEENKEQNIEVWMNNYTQEFIQAQIREMLRVRGLSA